MKTLAGQGLVPLFGLFPVLGFAHVVHGLVHVRDQVKRIVADLVLGPRHASPRGFQKRNFPLGSAHEYLHSSTAKALADLPAITLSHHADGGSRPGRLERYLALLLRDHEQDPESARTIFYIAQTYLDLGNYGKALEWHARRVAMGGWEEEQWYSAYMMVRCKQLLEAPWPEILQGYLECYEMRPTRLEPLQRICEHQRNIKHYALNYVLSRPVLDTLYPNDSIFIERPVYRYSLLMERAVAAFWTERFDEASELFRRVLAVPGLPENYRRSARKLLAAAKEDPTLLDSTSNFEPRLSHLSP